MNNFEVNADLLISDDGGVPKYVTVFRDGIPTWERLQEDENGQYIITSQNGDKYYVFEWNN